MAPERADRVIKASATMSLAVLVKALTGIVIG